jgi:hypothetical protein
VTQAWRDWAPVLVVSLVGLPLAALVAVGLAGWRRGRGLPARTAWWRSGAEVGLVAGTLPWIWLTLSPRPEPPQRTWLVPFSDLANQVTAFSPAELVVQIGGNLLVFAALGFFAPIRYAGLGGILRLFALGAAASAVVETLQHVLDLGRVSSVDDVLLNAIGAALAGLLSRPWWAARSDRPARARPPVPSAR